MNMKINKNLIFLGALVVFLGFSQVADAAYVCEPHAIVGTDHFVTSCYNTTPNYVDYSTVGRLGDSSNTGPGMGAPIAYSYDSGYNTNYNNTNYNNGYNNTNPNNNVNTTNTSNGVSTNNSSTNKSTTVTRTSNTTSNKVATSNTNNNSNKEVAGTTNVSNTEGSNLSANGLTALSLQGSDSFLPDTVWEWICVFFLILIIIILIRQFKGKPSHDVHHAAPHH